VDGHFCNLVRLSREPTGAGPTCVFIS
jgi:hypothetical protein